VKVETIPIDRIDIGERRRRDYGDIGALAKGIERVGLLEPIIVERNGKKDRFRLICGERRLKAIQLLRRPTIDAQLLEYLSEAELRDIELEENENRKALTERERTLTFEASEKLLGQAKRAAAVISNAPLEKDPRGRKSDHGAAKTEIADALGVSHAAIRRAEQHVATVEQFPFMKAGKWRQSDVLRIRERIEELPQTERDDAAGVIGCAKLMDPDMAVTLVENLASKQPEERKQIYDLSKSADSRDKSLALTKAAELPPMPDPRLGILENILKSLQAAIKPFPDDPLTPELIQIHSTVRTVKNKVEAVSFDARRNRTQTGATVQ
jgi:ParB-like chromosome segregation protein Spo0J